MNNIKTQNEKAQAYISEGITECRALGLPNALLGDYCAAYLAQKLAATADCKTNSFTQRERDRLADWMENNRDSAREVRNDLSIAKLAALARKGEWALGDYVMSKITEAMLYELESTDAEPCHIAEDDMRSRTRDARLDANTRGYW